MEPSETALRRGDSWRLGAETCNGSKHGLLMDIFDRRGVVDWVERAIGEVARNSWEETG